jgi:hypothetical protein
VEAEQMVEFSVDENDGLLVKIGFPFMKLARILRKCFSRWIDLRVLRCRQRDVYTTADDEV